MRPIPEGGPFEELDLDIHYEGYGDDILGRFVRPALGAAERYDRVTSFFTVASLQAIAEGIEQLWRRGGSMRVVLGIHDVPSELVRAGQLQDEDADAVLEAVRRRLLKEISTLKEELERNRLATLAWMMKDGLLHVRAACPTDVGGNPGGHGIFHQKRLIFTGPQGNVVSAVGSPNETASGLGANYEELTVHRSWKEGQRPYVERHQESFEELWQGVRPGIETRELSEEFADQILDRLGNPSRPTDAPATTAIDPRHLHELVTDSPAYSVLAFEKVGLYPHQERVFVEALSRWPVRVLLADEVGLGKTLEAGAIIAYMLRFTHVEDVTILAPANLLKQWQEELALHFGLEFWRWDSTTNTFIAPDGQTEGSGNPGSPLGPGAPARVLISAQLARGTKRRGHIYEGRDERPDLLIVDEAHAARIRPDLDGTLRPTRLWSLLDEITDDIPHLLLLTATPLQMEIQEYHALLSLIGLPSAWADLDAYERSLRILSRGDRARGLQSSRWLLKLIGSTAREMGWAPDGLTDAQQGLLEMAIEAESSPSLSDSKEVMASWDEAYELFVRSHPAHISTIRNTRRSLMRRGYTFPERRLKAPPIEAPEAVERFYDSIESYLKDGYGLVEDAADPDRHFSIGFVKSSYHQRLASSLHAARCSLENRLRKLEAVLRGGWVGPDPSEEEYDEPDELDEEIYGSVAEKRERANRSLERAFSIESTYLKDLLALLDQVEQGGGTTDPKMAEMLSLLEDHLPDEKVLIFSRYTDTLDACLEAYHRELHPQIGLGHGLYTGDEAWIQSDAGRMEATKEDVREALEDGEIHVVFCSEAAAEGLNLQAAMVMINIDVPWNPAKLEQRIGRIARLGQTAEEVVIYNLWYPNSVEAKMYGRLMQRKDLYDLAVGEAPRIVSDAIRQEVTVRLGSASAGQGTDALGELQEIRESLQHNAMQEVWGHDLEPLPLSTRVRKGLLQMLGAYARTKGIEVKPEGDRLIWQLDDERLTASSAPGARDVLTLTHPIWGELLGRCSPVATDGERNLAVLNAGAIPVGFAITGRDNETFSVLPSRLLPTLFATALSGGPLPQELAEWDSTAPSDDSTWREIRAASRWLPNHQKLRVPPRAGRETQSLDPEGYGQLSVEPLGPVAIEGEDA